jgi:toxin ParE1/3/4
MKKRASFHELAELELNDAIVYFENEREGLGSRFLSAVQDAVILIQQHPQASPIILEDIRCKVLFPYSIMFSITPDRIRILALANQKRRPFYWQGRQ